MTIRCARWVMGGIVVLAATVAMGCTSDAEDAVDANDTADADGRTTTAPPSDDPVRPEVEITSPPAEGAGLVAPQPSPPLPDGYLEEEYFLGGTARSFEAVETPDDGFWAAAPADAADYRTRVIVRRPSDDADFSGTVLVEWFNVSAIEAAPDWAYLSDAIGRDGHAYVGVSAQALGVEGGSSLLEVDFDDAEIDELGENTPDTGSGGLRNADPDRYSTLTHPGDAYAFDIFTQVGHAAKGSPDELLGDLEPQQVIAMGESQSAMFLTTLVNAVHPIDPVFDAFLIHSRGARGPSLDGTYTRRGDSDDTDGTDSAPAGLLIRTDLDVPVMQVQAETDLTLLGFVRARQPDTDLLRTWEIAGTAHADSETLRGALGGPRDPGIGSILGCGPVNSGPHKEVLRAAVSHLVEWASGGDAPPEADPLEVDLSGEPAIVRDERGNALGGIRTPMVDVPAATLSGDPAEDANVICGLFGQTIPFDRETMVDLYGDADSYFERFEASSAEAVAAGFLLEPDAVALRDDMEPVRELFA